jgi:hypothetical protein
MTKAYKIAGTLLTIIFLSVTLLNSSYSQTTGRFWSGTVEGDFIVKGERRIIPDEYKTTRLDLSGMTQFLSRAPEERTERAITSPSIVELPLPDGSMASFYVVKYSMMEEPLAKQFPDIITLTVKGINDPYATGKLDVTAHGFHGMVLTPRGDFFIDPYSSQEKEVYITYYKSKYRAKKSFECLVNEIAPNKDIVKEIDATGEQLRTYRLANAATGEYTAFHGGTVALGQAAIVTSINRVNGVYEKDVSVRMTLVANNTSIVYTNASTDPYTNGSGTTMLGQNQTNCDAVIGTANYDIGHVFSTGGGGVAGLGVVCVAGNKARGVTGSGAPIGDPFDIDYVAHEMGHQFRGNHTFNGTQGSCAGGNRNASTAWEPGSASTIMGYAGICGTDDLQPNSDDLFHTGSITEIAAYTQTGSGNSCPVTTNTGNTPPSVTVPVGGFTIPINTPFQLTGSATDVNNPNSLTYIWEQYDVGPAGAPNSPSGNAPIFRSFKPDTAKTRTFPKISSIVNNTSTLGEILPSYTRSLVFRLTVRDNNPGGGGIGIGTITFNVNSAAGPFTVTSPNTAVNWNSSVQQTVTWNVANTTAAPVSCANVNIRLSTDGGFTYPTLLLANTPNDGSQLVTLPGVNTTTARIKVEAVGNIFFDISNTNFTISNTSLPSIAHTPIVDQLKSSWPVNVDAVVTSIYPLDSVWVVWYKNSAVNTKRFKLINTSGNNYSAAFNSLNSDVVVGDQIYYKIFAQNNSAGHEKDSTAQYNFRIIDNKLCEGFFSTTFPPSGWAFEPSSTYWTRNAVSSYGVGSGSAKFDYWSAAAGTTEILATKIFETTSAGDSLKFDHAYAPYTDGSTDSLEILSSTNSGSTYTTLVRMWGNNTTGNLNTVAASASAFTPTSVQWQTKKYALPSGTNKIRFRARSGFGNNLYIDSVCVVNAAAAVPATITFAQEGFYNSSTNRLNAKDTVRVYLRSITSPFAVIDSAKGILDSVSLSVSALFSTAPTGIYYLQLKHRNCLETWSKSGGVSYTKGLALSYDFTTAANQAFGSNMKQVDAAPVRFAIYSGEINGDGTIDGSDLIAIDNDAGNFVVGYVKTDLDGNNFVDATDALIADNNAANFVSVIRP